MRHPIIVFKEHSQQLTQTSIRHVNYQTLKELRTVHNLTLRTKTPYGRMCYTLLGYLFQ